MNEFTDYFIFSSKELNEKVLKVSIKLESKFLDQICSRNQNFSFFMKEIHIFQFLEDFLPLDFQENEMIFASDDHFFNFLSEMVEDKITSFIEKEEYDNFKEIKSFVDYFFNVSILPTFLQDVPKTNSKELHKCLIDLRNFYIRNIEEASFSNFNNNFLNNIIGKLFSINTYLELINTWCKCSISVKNMINIEGLIQQKYDECSVCLSNPPPEICKMMNEFNENVQNSLYLFQSNSAISNNLHQMFCTINQKFNDFKVIYNGFSNIGNKELIPLINSFFELISDSFLNILKKENFTLHSIQPSTFLYNEDDDNDTCLILDKMMMKIEEVKEINYTLSNELIRKESLEELLYQKYTIQSSSFIREICNCFLSSDYFFNHIIEDLDVFDESVEQIGVLKELFENKNEFDHLTALSTSLEYLDKHVYLLNELIQEKKEIVELFQTEIKRVNENNYLNQKYKNMILEEQNINTTNIFERNYSLATCGHTLSDEEYQIICVLPQNERFCPYCKLPFTFDDIIKINWNDTIEEESYSEEQDNSEYD